MKNKLVLLILLYGVPFAFLQTPRPRNTRNARTAQNPISYNNLLPRDGNREWTQDAVIVDRHIDDLVMLGTGEGQTKRSNGKVDDDDEKKSLAQQVADGKYGLIQSELFSGKIKRPGIVSYQSNPEVPKDNKHSLGGLKSKDIWLAEDHLLVLKGGVFGEDNQLAEDKPIDDYNAPKRQVKIPNKPDVPPPFPVQLYDNGPLEFIEPNGTKHPVSNESFAYPTQGFIPGSGPFFPQTPPQTPQIAPSPYAIPFGQPGNLPAGNGKPIRVQPFPQYPVPPTNRPPVHQPLPALPQYPLPKNIPANLLPPVSVLKNLPPGAVFLPPPTNQSDLYDEDDPSIYYPPPYSFYYSSNTDEGPNKVAAGPLVPGIILPPPPDFFGPMDNETETTESLDEPEVTTIATTTTEKPRAKVPKWKPTKYRVSVTETPITTTTNRPETPEIQLKPIYVVDDRPEKIVIDLPSTQENVIPEKGDILPIVPADDGVNGFDGKHITDEYITDLQKEIKKERPTTTRPAKTKLVSVTSSFRPINEYYDQKLTNKKTKLSTSTPYVKKITKQYSQPSQNNGQPQEGDNLLRTLPDEDDLRSHVESTPGLWKYNEGDVETNSITPILSVKPSKASYYYDDKKDLKTKKPRQYPQLGSQIDQELQFVPLSQQNGYNNGPHLSFLDLPPSPAQIQQYQRAINDQIEKIKEDIRLILAKNQVTQSARAVYEYSFQAKDYKPITNSIHHIQTLQQFQEYLNALHPQSRKTTVTENPDKRQNKLTHTDEGEGHYDPETHAPTKRKPAFAYHNHRNEYADNYKRPAHGSIRHDYQNNAHTPLPAHVQASAVTPNPVFAQHYTKHDERYIDDITRHYFTMFGQKIANDAPTTPFSRNQLGTATVTPLPPLAAAPSPSPPPKNLYVYPESGFRPNRYTYEPNPNPNPNPNPQPHNPYAQTLTELQGLNKENKRPLVVNGETPISLVGDTLVNYRDPRPGINPDAEFLPISQLHGGQSLAEDTDVNYKLPRPTINPLAESIGIHSPNLEEPSEIDELNTYPNPDSNNPNLNVASNYHRPQQRPSVVSSYVQQQYQQHPHSYPNYQSQQQQQQSPYYNQYVPNPGIQAPKRGSYVSQNTGGAYVSYQLPGNGAHFYFLTPQAMVNRKQSDGFYYEDPRQRLRKRNRTQRSNRPGETFKKDALESNKEDQAQPLGSDRSGSK